MAAYEQADMNRRQEEKKRTLADFSAMADGHRQDNVPETEPAQDIASENESRVYHSGGNGRTGAFASSASAYNDINATLGSFYESPEEDPEKEALESRGGTAPTGCRSADGRDRATRNRWLCWRSPMSLPPNICLRAAAREQRTVRRRKVPQGRGRRKPFPSGWCPLRSCRPFLSLLPIRYSSQDCFPVRISAFHTAVGSAGTQMARNTIRACVHGDQTVISGQSVRLRLAGGHACGKICASPQYPADR